MSTSMMIAPGATIGILGGGQLGRMMTEAASALGYQTFIYSDKAGEPGLDVARQSIIAPYTDEHALRHFASQCAVVTYEFENIPHAAVSFLAQHVLVRPGWKALHISQNRLREKQFFDDIGVPTNDYLPVMSLADLQSAYPKLPGGKGVLKVAESGYDGKGQAVVKSAEDLETAWQAIGQRPAILEAFVPFVKEISVITARTVQGETRAFPCAENTHKNGVLDVSVVPAGAAEDVANKARIYGGLVAQGLEAVGLTTVEFFVLPDGELLANEIAPRVHNSGHWTQDGCVTSQFEQHIRAICGLPLGDVTITQPVTMKNLLGDDIQQWQYYIEQPHAKLHLYGKKEVLPGRKMGHVNLLGAD